MSSVKVARQPSYSGRLDYAQTVMTDSPALYWRLDEGTGTTAYDLTANARNGTYTGTYTLNQSGAIAGDGAVALDGSTAYITSSYNPFTNASSRTFEVWFNRNAADDGSGRILFGGFAAFGSGPLLQISGSTGNTVFFTQSTGVTWANSVPATTAQWVHLVLTFNESTDVAELFINGLSQGQRSQTDPYAASPGNFEIGTLNNSQQYFFGTVDEVAIYTSILSPARILAHYQART